MPRITDAINDLHVDEATFAKVYEKVILCSFYADSFVHLMW